MKAFGLIVDYLVSIANQDNLILVTDMWVYLCLGLRPNELKHIKILTKSGNGAMFLKLK